jgi:hypothetical protein
MNLNQGISLFISDICILDLYGLEPTTYNYMFIVPHPHPSHCSVPAEKNPNIKIAKSPAVHITPLSSPSNNVLERIKCVKYENEKDLQMWVVDIC